MISWVEHTGVIGGWPPVVKTYWEGFHNSKRKYWITSLSNGEWHLVSAGNQNNISIRDKNCDKLKKEVEEND